jgi:hypothetical protein
MADVAKLIADMVKAGVDPDLIGRTAEALSSREAIIVKDEAAERRRAKDRERKALRKSAESDGIHGTDDVPLSPKEVSPAPLQEITPFLPTTHKENPPKGGQKKASRLPSDWVLPVEWRQDGRDVGLAESAIDLEADKMRDWSRSSPKGARLDWRAQWRNWCRGAAPNQRGSPPPGKPRSVLDAINALNTRMEQADAISSEAIEGTGATVFRLSAAQQR